MNLRGTFGLVTAAALALSTSSLADTPPSGSTTPTDVAASASSNRVGWGGVGFYDVGVSVNTPFGSYSASNSYFGFNAGAAVNVLSLTPELPLAVFGNAAIAFGSGGFFLPLTGGAALRYDKLPVKLLGGLGLTVMPNSAGYNTSVGLGILAMAMYPLPQIDPRLSAEAQLQYHFLNNSMWLFAFTVGAGYTF